MGVAPLPPLIVLVGATAVGKTGLAITLAQALNGEIVGADSRQVYRWMDIGTAKPTLEEQAAVPHHLINVVNPDDTLSLGNYLKLANTAIAEIYSRGRLPLLVGGTGQYITALIEGWDVPEVSPDPQFRAEMEQYAAEYGALALGKRLQSLDPVAFAQIDYRNVRRVIRALEVIRATGEPFSAQRTKTPPPYRILHYGLTLDRDSLYQRADRRVDSMIRVGFVEEVRMLLERGYPSSLPSMSGLGYKELAAHILDGVPLDESVQAIYSATHDFIRRQETWFRKYNKAAHWIDGTKLNSAAVISDIRGQL